MTTSGTHTINIILTYRVFRLYQAYRLLHFGVILDVGLRFALRPYLHPIYKLQQTAAPRIHE